MVGMSHRRCSVKDCDRPHIARGLCRKHYNAAHHVGTLPEKWYKPTILKRFLERVDKRRDGCWLWRGSVSPSGYGQFAPSRESYGSAHRWAYKLFCGPIPVGAFVLHTCDVRTCVNPSHLFLGSGADNMADMTAKGRQAAGIRHGMCTVSPQVVAEIKDALSHGERQVDIARRLGMSRNYVWNIAHGHRAAG